MSRMTLEQAARWCGGTVAPQYAQVSFLGASNDSRSLEPGQLFVALEGARDGHEFIPGALAAGAAAVLCSRCDGDFPAIVVRDPRKALGDIARQERIRLNLKVVGVTGSVGKSTTKEMIAGILSRKYRTGKTPVNHNNDIGMPMAILGAARGHGGRRPGDGDESLWGNGIPHLHRGPGHRRDHQHRHHAH